MLEYHTNRQEAALSTTELTRVTSALARALSMDDVNQIGRDTGQSERLRTITPHRLFLSTVAGLAGGQVESLADLLREFNHQNDVTVAYKAFYNRRARPGFTKLMHQMFGRLIVDVALQLLPVLLLRDTIDTDRRIRTETVVGTDGWFERDVVPRIHGRARLIRYADDAVIGFENEADAWKVLEALKKRFERYGLRLHPEKTRVVPFERPEQTKKNGKARATLTHRVSRNRHHPVIRIVFRGGSINVRMMLNRCAIHAL